MDNAVLIYQSVISIWLLFILKHSFQKKDYTMFLGCVILFFAVVLGIFF